VRPIIDSSINDVDRKVIEDLGKNCDILHYEYENGRICTLVIRCSEDIDISPIGMLRELRILRIFDTPISDISFLSAVEKIISLDLRLTRVENIEPIKNLKILKELDISHTRVVDIAPIANLNQLEILNMNALNIQTIEPITNNKNLRILSIAFCYGVRRIDSIENMKNLEHLDISHTNISDISPIIDLAETYGNIRTINLTDTNIPNEQIRKLINIGVNIIKEESEYGLRL